MTWHQVKQNQPCAICSKPDWCGRSNDGAIRCMRISDPPKGWRKVKSCPDGGAVFRPIDETKCDSRSQPELLIASSSRSARTSPTLCALIASTARRMGSEHDQTWTYHGPDGNEAFYVARFNLPNGSKQFRPFHHNGIGYVIGDPPGDDQLPLYRLGNLSGHPRVFIVEGEKCADVAASIGLPATTSAHGSKSAAKTDWQPLADREVVIVPDQDEAGRYYAETVAGILGRLHPPAVVRVVELPDLSEHGDIADFIETRRAGKKDDLEIRKEIEHLAKRAELINLAPPPNEVLRYRPFPISALPKPVSGFVSQAAEAIGCDPSYIALPLLSTFASAIGNSRRIELKRGWSEPAIVWTAIVGDSGTLKTPAFKLAMQPVRDRQGKALKAHAEAMQEFELEQAEYERAYQQWKRKGVGDPPTKPNEPEAERCIVSDTTVEALAPILRENPQGVLLARDELAGWIGSFDRYAGGKGGADAAHWLSMHNAESIVVDRKTGQHRTIYVPRASVSVTGGIQPAIFERSLDRGHRESGMAARLLLAWPPRHPKQWTETEISQRLEAAIAEIFDRLFTMQPPRDDQDELHPTIVPLTASGKIAWIAFYNEHAREHAELTGDLSAAWSKLEGYAARLALVVHSIRLATDDPTLEDAAAIDSSSIAAGVALSRWFGHEARRVYAMLGESEDDRDHRRLVELLERKGRSTSVRDWQRARSHRTADDAEAELKALEAAGYGCLRPAQQTGRGRPSKVFTLHPDRADVDRISVTDAESSILSVSEGSDAVRSKGKPPWMK